MKAKQINTGVPVILNNLKGAEKLISGRDIKNPKQYSLKREEGRFCLVEWDVQLI